LLRGEIKVDHHRHLLISIWHQKIRLENCYFRKKRKRKKRRNTCVNKTNFENNFPSLLWFFTKKKR